MKAKKIIESTACIEFEEDELIVIHNSFNEVCNRLKIDSLFTNLGVSKDEVEGILKTVTNALIEIEKKAKFENDSLLADEIIDPKIVCVNSGLAQILFTNTELGAISDVINIVVLKIDDWEYQTLIGFEKIDALTLCNSLKIFLEKLSDVHL